MLTQGLVAGLAAYAAVALFFAVVNLIGGRSPFHTAAALGSALFYGVRDPAGVILAPGPVLAYNGVHLIASLLVGMAVAWLFYEIERYHFLWYFAFFVLLIVFMYSLVFMGMIAAEMARALPWGLVVAGTVVWAAALGGCVWLQHRTLMAELKREQEAEA
jgi:hypothetical protein